MSASSQSDPARARRQELVSLSLPFGTSRVVAVIQSRVLEDPYAPQAPYWL
jgi:hypothetical protein